MARQGPSGRRAVEHPAEWRLNPIVERAVTDVRRRALKRRQSFQALLFSGLGLLPLLTGLAASTSIPTWVLPSGIVATFLIGVVALGRSARSSQTGLQIREALRHEYEHVGGSLIELTIMQGATSTGYDYGTLWVENGRLFFVGTRTSFGLVPSQVDSQVRASLAFAPAETLLRLPLQAQTAAGPIVLVLKPLPTDARTAGPQVEAELGWQVRSWLANPHPPREGQMPPLGFGPDAPTERFLLAQAIGATVFWIVVGTSLVLTVVGAVLSCAAFPLNLAFAAGVGWSLRQLWRQVGDPFERWCAWSDRRRLERSLRQNKDQ